MLVIPFGQTEKRWKEFVEALFKQPDFADAEQTSIQAIKNQFFARIDAFKRKFGNLSGEEGDKTELELIIQDMLKEKYDAENELTVLLRGVGESGKSSTYQLLTRFTTSFIPASE